MLGCYYKQIYSFLTYWATAGASLHRGKNIFMLLFYLSYFKVSLLCFGEYGLWMCTVCWVCKWNVPSKGKGVVSFRLRWVLGCWSRNWIVPSFWIKENVVFLWEAFKEWAYILSSNLALSFVVAVVLLLFKKKKKKGPDSARNFLIKLILNLPENTLFQISEKWAIITFSIHSFLHSVSFWFFLKVHYGVSSEREQCYFP